jgi:hypothetical protein
MSAACKRKTKAPPIPGIGIAAITLGCSREHLLLVLRRRRKSPPLLKKWGLLLSGRLSKALPGDVSDCHVQT